MTSAAKPKLKKEEGKGKLRPRYTANIGTAEEEEEKKSEPIISDKKEQEGKSVEEVKPKSDPSIPANPSEESGSNSFIIKKTADIYQRDSEELNLWVGRCKELEQKLEDEKQKSNEAEFLLREFIEEFESENSQYEDDTKTLYNEKAVMSVALKAREVAI